jgi:hypothetical protein
VSRFSNITEEKTPLASIWDTPPVAIMNTYAVNVPGNFAENQFAKQNNAKFENGQNASYNNDQMLKLREMGEKRNPSAFQQRQDRGSGSDTGIGHSIKISNVSNDTYYKDIRRFFFGLAIGQNDIKIINDEDGNRTGIVLVRFLSEESKKVALQQSSASLKRNVVTISSISDDEYVNTDDRFNPSLNSRFGRPNYEEGDDEDRRNTRKTDDFWQENEPKRNFNQANDDDDWDSKEPQEDSRVVIIDDLPKSATLDDIKKIFPKLVDAVIDKYVAYVIFATHDDAKATIEDRFNHYINNKRVFLYPGSNNDFERVSKKSKPARRHYDEDNNEQKRPRVGNNDEPIIILDDNDDDYPSDPRKSNKDRRSPGTMDFFSGRNNYRRIDENEDNIIDLVNNTSDCVIMRNLETKITDKDVVKFFGEEDILPTKVHILLDKQGEFSSSK